MRTHSRDTICPRFTISLLPLEQRAQGRPGAGWHPLVRAQWVERNAHGFDRYSRDIPAFPAQWVDGLYVLSPVSGVDCHRCRARTGGPDRRHGRGARTTRFRRTLSAFSSARLLALTPQASIATRATLRDDRETSLMAAR